MSRLGGRFALGEKIGSGGMSEVFLGTDEVLDRTVAIKVLRGGFEGSDVGARFSREGRTAARLSHPNVVQVYDAGESELDGREVSYIVMEYVPGGDLKEMMDERGPLGEGAVARIGADVVSGLAHAHERGIVHRDIKPQNILIDDYGRPKLTDFGIAKALDATTSTQTGSYLGTALYSSPEQLRGEPATLKSDVYAFGATLYHAVLGEPPFSGGPIEVASQQLSKPATPPRARGAEVGARMDGLIMRCLSKDPGPRPETSKLQSELLSICAAADTMASAPPVSESASPGVGSVQAAGAAAIAGIAYAAKAAGERGAAGVGAAARGIQTRLGSEEAGKPTPAGDPTRTVTVPTRTFRPGHERNKYAFLFVGALALLVAAFFVWGIFTLFTGPETAQNTGSSGAAPQQEADSGAAGDNAEADGADAGGSNAQQPESNAAQDTPKDKPKEKLQSSDPTPPAGEAADVVYGLYLAIVNDRDYDGTWNTLSSRYQDEVGSLEDWEDEQSSLTSFSVTSGLETDRVENGKAYVDGEVQENRNSGSQTLSGPWLLVAEDGEWKVDRLPEG